MHGLRVLKTAEGEWGVPGGLWGFGFLRGFFLLRGLEVLETTAEGEGSVPVGLRRFVFLLRFFLLHGLCLDLGSGLPHGLQISKDPVQIKDILRRRR